MGILIVPEVVEFAEADLVDAAADERLAEVEDCVALSDFVVVVT